MEPLDFISLTDVINFNGVLEQIVFFVFRFLQQGEEAVMLFNENCYNNVERIHLFIQTYFKCTSVLQIEKSICI